MKGKLFVSVVSGLFAIATAACSQPTTTSTSTSTSSMSSMSTSTAQATGPIRSTGVVTQVDAAAGTITFNHEAIPAINWPAMTMQFHAENPAVLNGIAVGDHVAFELKSASEASVVTMVQKQ